MLGWQGLGEQDSSWGRKRFLLTHVVFAARITLFPDYSAGVRGGSSLSVIEEG